MAAVERGASRRGGRDARRAMRAAPQPENERPIRPGLEGGRFKPLKEEDVSKVHEAVLDVLENIGIGDAIPSCVDYVTAAGGRYENGRLLFPRALVEDTIAKANRDFILCGQDPRHDIEPAGNKVYFGTAGAAVEMVDPKTGDFRESTLKDLYDIARMVDALDNIHFFQTSVVPRDLPDPRDMDVNTCYAAVSGTTKHVGTRWFHVDHLSESLEMLHHIAGGEDKWRERPFVSMSCCHVVPPLKFAEESQRCLELAARAGMPVLLLSAGQAGATSPAALAGSVVQATAECLAGLVYINQVQAGAKAIFGTWPFVSDLRTGAMSGGSGEQAVLMAACAQMGRFYDLPSGVAAGMTDSKVPDAQSGYEKGYTETLAGHSGANMIYESAGMHASLLGFCLESLVIDNDMIGSILRTVRGVEVNEETLSIETMRDVCIGGPGHYLGHDQTISLMQRDYVYPQIGDRSSPKEWNERGRPQLLDLAAKRKQEILASHYPRHVSDEVDRRIRSAIDIALPREVMSPNA